MPVSETEQPQLYLLCALHLILLSSCTISNSPVISDPLLQLTNYLNLVLPDRLFAPWTCQNIASLFASCRISLIIGLILFCLCQTLPGSK